MPIEQDCSAIGLLTKGWSFTRDTQSIAFFSPPGMVQLYSGETMMTPSAARIASASAVAAGGKPCGLNVGIVERHLDRRRRLDGHAGGRETRQQIGQHVVVASPCAGCRRS